MKKLKNNFLKYWPIYTSLFAIVFNMSIYVSTIKSNEKRIEEINKSIKTVSDLVIRHDESINNIKRDIDRIENRKNLLTKK